MRLLGISGSLRQGSYNAALLDAAAAECPTDVEFAVWHGLAEIPAYNEDVDVVPSPSPVGALRDEIERADAMLIATPEYNASIPGALKNALDWASRPFAANALRRKRVAVIGASTGLFGAVWAQADLRKVLSTMGASVLDAELSIPAAHAAFTAEGRLREPALELVLRRIVHELLEPSMERAA